MQSVGIGDYFFVWSSTLNLMITEKALGLILKGGEYP